DQGSFPRSYGGGRLAWRPRLPPRSWPARSRQIPRRYRARGPAARPLRRHRPYPCPARAAHAVRRIRWCVYCPPGWRLSGARARPLALAESLLQCHGVDGADMARRFAATWARALDRGYGSNVAKVFRSVLAGVDWKEAAESQFGGAGSYGNGGAMRVTPVALWAYPDLEETARLAAETATVTHTHPVGVEGAVIQAVAVHYALSDEFQPARLLADLDERIETDGFRAKLGELESCLENGDDDQARRRLGNSVAADGSVMTAI